MATDLTGQTVGPFYVDGILGKGAMGAVFRARHIEKGFPVAIKIIDPANGNITPTLVKRFEREIELLKRFKHKNIVRFKEEGTFKKIRYYAMEMVDGESLEAVLAKRDRLLLSQACQLIWQLCDALEEMHSEGVVHRDLKPANIIVDKQGTLKLTDLGIAKDTSQVFNSKLTDADTTVGTVAYMAPEQLAGKDLSRRSDLYAMGIMFYQLVTGRLPFTGKTVFDYINQRQAGIFPKPSQLNNKIPLELDNLICSLMQNDPEDRPRDARVVQQMIKEIAEKSQRGELTKTAPVEDDILGKTEELKTEAAIPQKIKSLTGSLAGSIFGTLGGISSKKKKKRRDEPFWESPWAIVGALLLVATFTAWMLWPLSEDALFERGKELMQSKYRSDWDVAMEKYLQPLLDRFPNSKYVTEITAFQDQILTEDCQKKVEMAHRLGRLPDDASEAFRKYFEAHSVSLLLNNKMMANQQFKAIADLFEGDPKSRGWVLLARKQLVDEGKISNDSERAEAKRAALKESIAKANELRSAGKIPEYFRICESIINLYGSDTEVAEIVSQVRKDVEDAKQMLKGKS